jgi:hypothetical protein
MLSEVGTLEVHCVAKENAQRWLLEFQLRGEAEPEAADETPMPAGLPALEKSTASSAAARSKSTSRK